MKVAIHKFSQTGFLITSKIRKTDKGIQLLTKHLTYSGRKIEQGRLD
jgi:hypothetical protein